MGAGSGALLNGEGGARGDGEGGGDLWAAGARHAGGNSPPPFWRILSLPALHCYPVLLQMRARECSLKPERCGLQVGNWADLLLFDPATINSTPTERVADLPAGASRLTRRSVGVFGTCTPCAKPFLVWMASRSRQCELSCLLGARLGWWGSPGAVACVQG